MHVAGLRDFRDGLHPAHRLQPYLGLEFGGVHLAFFALPFAVILLRRTALNYPCSLFEKAVPLYRQQVLRVLTLERISKQLESSFQSPPQS